MFKIEETKIQKNGLIADRYRRVINSFLTIVGLLFLTLIFGASSDAFGQKNQAGKANEPKQNEPKPEKNSTPTQEDRTKPKPELITDDNGNVTGGRLKWSIDF